MKWKRVGFVVMGALLFAIFFGHTTGTSAGGPLQPSAMGAADEGYVHLFDSDAESYVFTFTLPMLGTNPRDVDVVTVGSAQDVWFTEPGADRIGQLVYTDTNDISYHAYDVGAGCYPLNLEIDGDWVWFTAPGCDQVGRLSRQTGDVDTFDVAPTGSYPADLAVASDGSIWFTQMQADQLAHLVVTSTVDYGIETFQAPSMDGGRPYGVVLAGISVYVAQTANGKVSEYTPSTDFWVDVVLPGVSQVDYPYKLARGNSDHVWATERAGNRITRFDYGTFAVLVSYDLEPVGSSPMGLAAGVDDDLWFTQWSAGQIGRLATDSKIITYYPLSSSRLLPTGIEVEGSHVWVVATKPYQVYLPLVMHGGE